jgi:gliding motility-associated-like protein
MNCKLDYINYFKVVIFSILYLLLTSVSMYGQRNKNWYFSNNNGLKFENGNVIPLNSGQITNSPSSTVMSDENGNLLFYSNGLTVWNKNHQIMTNGSGLKSNLCSYQTTISLPMPGNDSLYYIFHILTDNNCNNSSFPLSDTGYYYSIINMNKNNGLGEVITKNIKFANSYSRRITAITHQNNTDFWIITSPRFSPSICAFKLSISGLSLTPVESTVGQFLGEFPNSETQYGMLCGSPDGKYLIRSVPLTNSTLIYNAEVFQFDNQNGIISNPIKFPQIGTLNGFVFSPDSKRIYASLTNNSGHQLCQFSVLQYDSLSIANSATIIITYPFIQSGEFRDKSTAPDNKIYVGRSGFSLGVIHNPNDSGINCNFQDYAVSIGASNGTLPHFYNSINSSIPYLSIITASTACYSYTLSFNSNLKGITIKKWSLGDGTSSTDSVVTHTFNPALADSFLVKFSIVKQGSTDTLKVEKWLHLNKKPLVNFNAITNGCIIDSVQFTSNITPLNNAPINTIVWSLGNGSFINQQSNFNYLYNDTGIYNIKLFAKDNLGCTSDTATTTIAVNKKAVAKFGIIAPYCNNITVALKDSSIAYNSNTNLWKYYISNGDSIVNALTGNQFYNFTIAGNYTIKQIIKTNDGCLSDTISKTITIYPKPTAQFATPQNCVLDKSIFTDSSTSITGNTITHWQWNFGDANSNILNPNTSNTQNGTHQYTQASNYLVQLIVTTNNNCSDTLTKSFTVNGAIPKAAITLAQQSFCSGDTSRFIDNSYVNFGSLTKLRWLFNGTDSVVVNNPAAGSIYLKKFTSFGTPATQQIPVQLKVQSGINCVNTLDTFIVLKAQPKVVFTPINAVCQNTNPFFITNATEINNALGVGKYTGAGLVNNMGLYNPKLVTSNNNYTILYEFTTALGCSDTASQQINILDTPYINAGNNKVILEGGQVQLNAIVSGNSNLSFLWLPNIALNNNLILQPTASPTDNITYTITATQSNNCSSSDSVSIQVLKSLIIPNAFSPNGDRINDTWVIPYLESYPNAKLFVYSRNGQLVFESTGYIKAWDGTLNGKPLPVGSYYYFIQPGSGRKPYTGVVTILR